MSPAKSSERTPDSAQRPLYRVKSAPISLVFFMLAVLALSSCAVVEPKPYWAANNDGSASCLATEIESGCGTRTPELWRLRIGDGFRLHFVEFDDQGWLYDEANRQIDWVMQDLAQLARSGKQLRLVIYVHGWKHNAEAVDPDVRKFRHMLAQLRAVDVASGRAHARELVGIYVGWRGKSWEKSTPLHRFLLNTTFWSRKAAAVRVAQGQPRELFARLRAFQEDANLEHKGGCPRSADGDLSCRVRTAIIGHSFGGWIVQAAIGESMIDVLAAQKDPKLPDSGRARTGENRSMNVQLERLADTILLINPAYEASRYDAVHRVAASLEPRSYRPPLLVSITSDKDVATSSAFPLGRAVNAFFEQTTSPRQDVAIRNTPGHIARYHTHELTYDATDLAECDGWRELYAFDERTQELRLMDEYANDQERLREQIQANLVAEEKKRLAFFDDHGGLANPSLSNGWARPLCGGLKLRQLQDPETENRHPNTPVWNIRTSGPIILNHNDFMTPHFINFVRQLYRDGELLR